MRGNRATSIDANRWKFASPDYHRPASCLLAGICGRRIAVDFRDHPWPDMAGRGVGRIDRLKRCLVFTGEA